MLLQITSVFLIVVFLGIIFAFCGEWLYCKTVPEGCSHPVSFKMGAGYFLGMAIFETLWKVMAYISGNAKITLALTILIMIFIALIKVKSLLPDVTAYLSSNIAGKIVKIILAVFSIALIYAIEIFFNTDSFSAGQFSVKTCLGSLHSGKYANIAAFISGSNYIPVLDQNYGQSMLAAVPLILGFNSPYLALNLWLSTSVIFMCLAFYGFFTMLGLNSSMSLAGSFLMMIGNTALSLFAIVVVDSGSPLFLTGYTDTLFSTGSFLGFLVLLKNFYDDQIKSVLYFSITAAILYISWSFTAPQNIILSAVLVTIISGIMLSKKRFSREHKLLYVLMVVFVLAGITQGGFMTPVRLCDNIEIPGAAGAAYNNRRGQSAYAMFEFPYFHFYKGKWVYGMFYEKREIYEDLNAVKGLPFPKEMLDDVYYELYYEIEANFFNSLRIIFFPLLGLILPWFIPDFRKTSADSGLSDMKKLWFVSFIVFLLGYCIAFFKEFNGFKWELSRFLIPGYAIATVSFIASLNIILKQVSRRKSWLIISVIMFIMTFGQISFIVYQAKRNVFDSVNNETLPFSERFKMLVGLQGMQALR